MKRKKIMTSVVVIAIGFALLWQPEKLYALYRIPTIREIGTAIKEVAKESGKNLIENCDRVAQSITKVFKATERNVDIATSKDCTTTLYSQGSSETQPMSGDCAQLASICANLHAALHKGGKKFCGTIVKVKVPVLPET